MMTAIQPNAASPLPHARSSQAKARRAMVMWAAPIGIETRINASKSVTSTTTSRRSQPPAGGGKPRRLGSLRRLSCLLLPRCFRG